MNQILTVFSIVILSALTSKAETDRKDASVEDAKKATRFVVASLNDASIALTAIICVGNEWVFGVKTLTNSVGSDERIFETWSVPQRCFETYYKSEVYDRAKTLSERSYVDSNGTETFVFTSQTALRRMNEFISTLLPRATVEWRKALELAYKCANSPESLAWMKRHVARFETLIPEYDRQFRILEKSQQEMNMFDRSTDGDEANRKYVRQMRRSFEADASRVATVNEAIKMCLIARKTNSSPILPDSAFHKSK